MLVVSRAAAEPAPPAGVPDESRTVVAGNVADQATRRFESGYRLAERGDYEGAAREFAEAYALSPKPSVLFNLGQSYAASGAPVEAYEAFREYLRLEAQHIDADRTRLVLQLMDNEAARFGELWLDIQPERASIEIDGQSIGNAPLAEPVRLKAGHHALVVKLGGYQTEIVNIEMEPRERSRRSIRLAAPPLTVSPGYVLLTCSVPDVELWVDQGLRGRSPLLEPVLVPPGQHTISLQRRGYVPQSSNVLVRSGQAQALTCEGRVEPSLASEHTTTLVIGDALQRQRALVEVDGRPLRRRETALPSGKHRVEVRAPGFDAWSGLIELEPRARFRLDPLLAPTVEYRNESIVRRNQRLIWSGVALAGGVALGATALTLAIVNSHKHERWRTERDALGAEPVDTDELAPRLQASYREALDIQRLEHATLASAVLGAACVGVSAFLWFTSEPIPGPHESRVQSRGWDKLTYRF
jgi:tetratricopeptide (TPR) repeat protein